MKRDTRGALTMDPLGPGLPPWLAFSLGGLSGAAALLRSGRHLTKRRVIATLLYNGLAALAVAWGVGDKLQGDPNLIGAVCILSGIGGASILDIVVAGIRATLTGPTLPGAGPK